MSYNPHGSGLILPGKTPGERLQHRLTSIEHASEESWRGETKWTNASYGSGWSSYNTASYFAAGYKMDAVGRVWMRGLIKNDSYITAVICTLPAGFRPTKVFHFSVVASGGYGQITVDTSGNVTHEAGLTNYISLAQISFETST